MTWTSMLNNQRQAYSNTFHFVTFVIFCYIDFDAVTFFLFDQKKNNNFF